MVDLYLTKKYKRGKRNVFAIEYDTVARRYHCIYYTHFVVHRHYWEMGGFKERSTLVPRSHGILLTRNIYATLASSYHHVRYRIGRKVTPSEFIRETKRGAVALITFYNLWLILRSEFLSASCFSYEALKRDSAGVFQDILEALGISPVDQTILRDVVNESTFNRMQQLALTEEYKNTPIAPTDQLNRNTWKVREGKANGFWNTFSEKDVNYIKRVIDDLLLDKTLVDTSIPVYS